MYLAPMLVLCGWGRTTAGSAGGGLSAPYPEHISHQQGRQPHPQPEQYLTLIYECLMPARRRHYAHTPDTRATPEMTPRTVTPDGFSAYGTEGLLLEGRIGESNRSRPHTAAKSRIIRVHHPAARAARCVLALLDSWALSCRLLDPLGLLRPHRALGATKTVYRDPDR